MDLSHIDLNYELLGKNMRDARKKSGRNQSEMATLLATNQSYISQIESGKKRVTLELLAAYSRFTGVSTDTLLNGVIDPTEVNIGELAKNIDYDKLSESGKRSVLEEIRRIREYEQDYACEHDRKNS